MKSSNRSFGRTARRQRTKPFHAGASPIQSLERRALLAGHAFSPAPSSFVDVGLIARFEPAAQIVPPASPLRDPSTPPSFAFADVAAFGVSTGPSIGDRPAEPNGSIDQKGPFDFRPAPFPSQASAPRTHAAAWTFVHTASTTGVPKGLSLSSGKPMVVGSVTTVTTMTTATSSLIFIDASTGGIAIASAPTLNQAPIFLPIASDGVTVHMGAVHASAGVDKPASLNRGDIRPHAPSRFDPPAHVADAGQNAASGQVEAETQPAVVVRPTKRPSTAESPVPPAQADAVGHEVVVRTSGPSSSAAGSSEAAATTAAAQGTAGSADRPSQAGRREVPAVTPIVAGGTTAVLDGRPAGAAAESLPQGSTASSVAFVATAPAQFAAVAYRVLSALRPTSPMPDGPAAPAADAAADAGLSLEGLSSLLPATTLGLAPWAPADVESNGLVWQVTAAGSFGLAAAGYLYTHAVAARRREMARAAEIVRPSRRWIERHGR